MHGNCGEKGVGEGGGGGAWRQCKREVVSLGIRLGNLKISFLATVMHMYH